MTEVSCLIPERWQRQVNLPYASLFICEHPLSPWEDISLYKLSGTSALVLSLSKKWVQCWFSRDSYHLKLSMETSCNTILNPVCLKIQTLSSHPEGSLWEVNQCHSLETVVEQAAWCFFTEKNISPSPFFEPGSVPISSTTNRQVLSSLCIGSYDIITCTQTGDVSFTS